MRSDNETWLSDELFCQIEKGLAPFKGIKLSRADIEWILATLENGRGPVEWSDKNQRRREGLDLRGADLCRENMLCLPLARTRAGLDWMVRQDLIPEQLNKAAPHFEEADLQKIRLEGSNLSVVVVTSL